MLLQIPEQRKFQVLLIWRQISEHRNLDIPIAESRTKDSGLEVRNPVRVMVY
jgi:hypothetical protein